MQWNDTTYAGFSNTKPWLPLNKTFRVVNVEKQINDENSLFSFFKKLIKLRKQMEILQKGEWQIVNEYNNKILAYKRTYNGNEIVVFLNFSNRHQRISEQKMSIVLSTHSINMDTVLSPFEGRITYTKSTNH